MKTKVVMKRELFGSEIAQQSKSEFFSATDLVRCGNKWRRANELNDFQMTQWLGTKNVKEFITEMEGKYGKCVKRSNKTTWVHPLLFIDMALAISPKLKVEVYEWLFDHLLKHRNDSGNSYREMSGSLYGRYGNHKQFPKFMSSVANYIKDACKVKDWQSANEKQLQLRDNIHRSIKMLCVVLDNPRDAVRIGVQENTKN